MAQGENSGGPKHKNATTLRAGEERTRAISQQGSSLGGKIGGPIGGPIGGASRSQVKVEAARRNGALSEGAPVKELSEIPCTCSAGEAAADAMHVARCLRGAAFRRRQNKKRKAERAVSAPV